MTNKPTLFSGVQPTGELHIGNYLGALKQWVELQNSGDFKPIFSVVDLHSLTEDFEPKKKKEQILNTAIDFLACGIDPEKSIIFIQSAVQEHAELAWILNCLTPVSELERMTQYKDKALRQKHNVNMGLFDYPVLMAADILLYQTQVVPVGEDQVQHVELARVLARKFNNKFGKFFFEPKSKLTSIARVMSLTDPNKKMSKSLGPKSYVALTDSADEITSKIKSAVTGEAGGKNILDLFKEFSEDKNLIQKFENEYKKGALKYAELKPALSEAIIQTLKPIQTRRQEFLSDKKKVEAILNSGALEASGIAQANMLQIKKLIGLI
jgi:tryptophanyl-tRNA synthetase